jgi:feruloyl-CoA synthase
MWAGKETSRADEVGIPAPGMTLKLARVEGKWEARFRGPNVTPGYWRQQDLTRAAFDEEGFYRMGDALRFVDQRDASRGFYFDGRVAEDFKLSTGTWVSVGPLRSSFLKYFAPYARDVVIAGRDRDYVTALVFPALDPCRGLCADLVPGADAGLVVAHPAVRKVFRERLGAMAAQSTGHSNRFVRVMLLDTPPSLDAHELTDKGSISQRAVLENRAAKVEEMYRSEPAAGVIGVED